ncbi:hypothetical protein GOP47_0016718 [Adiantum capillus-veneris]|uniref:Uncharacterized protein n=1 Tax=Adiantum capillus-veneris TaxID=13818 RepID=A0A9D4UJ40_ADICA|nr:hypothetical protein GOP47_0016718 [Adiantum capillus-veneris]
MMSLPSYHYEAACVIGRQASAHHQRRRRDSWASGFVPSLSCPFPTPSHRHTLQLIGCGGTHVEYTAPQTDIASTVSRHQHRHPHVDIEPAPSLDFHSYPRFLEGVLEMSRLENYLPSAALVFFGGWIGNGCSNMQALMRPGQVWIAAGCTGLITIASMLANDIFDFRSGIDHINGRTSPLLQGGTKQLQNPVVITIALFLFLCILSRELVMDVGDMVGDKAAGVNTLAVRFGGQIGTLTASFCLAAANALLIGLLAAKAQALATIGTLSLLPLHAKMLSLWRELGASKETSIAKSINQIVQQSMVHIGIGILVLASAA